MPRQLVSPPRPAPYRFPYLSLYRLIFILCCVFTLSPITAFALPSDTSQPIRLTADKATYSERTGVTTYTGNVIISQGTLKISANSVTVNLSKQGGITSILAQGQPASFEQVINEQKGLTKAVATTIDYNATTGIATFTGNAKLSQNAASFSGNTIRYSLKAGDIEAIAGGGQRVELILPPSNTVKQGIRAQ